MADQSTDTTKLQLGDPGVLLGLVTEVWVRVTHRHRRNWRTHHQSNPQHRRQLIGCQLLQAAELLSESALQLLSADSTCSSFSSSSSVFFTQGFSVCPGQPGTHSVACQSAGIKGMSQQHPWLFISEFLKLFFSCLPFCLMNLLNPKVWNILISEETVTQQALTASSGLCGYYMHVLPFHS